MVAKLWVHTRTRAPKKADLGSTTVTATLESTCTKYRLGIPNLKHMHLSKYKLIHFNKLYKMTHKREWQFLNFFVENTLYLNSVACMYTLYRQSWRGHGKPNAGCSISKQKTGRLLRSYSKLTRPGVITLHVREHLPVSHWTSPLQFSELSTILDS